MKKSLLTFGMSLLAAATMSAAVTTIEFKDVDVEEIVGTAVEASTSGDITTPKHWQPLEEFTYGNYNFSFGMLEGYKTAPAFYLANSGDYKTVRLYAQNTMTISALDGSKIGKLTFTTSNAKDDYTATVSAGACTYMNNVLTWASETPVESVTFTSNGTIRFSAVTIDTEGGEAPQQAEPIFSALGETDPECNFTFDDVALAEGLSYVWSWKEYNSKYYLNGSAYNQQAYAAQSYAISPVIDLAGYEGTFLQFDHAAKFQTTLRELCGVCVREVGTEEWTELTIPTWPEAGAWTFANSGNVDLSAFDGKAVQIAFKYGSSDAGADTWEIKNFKVYGTESAPHEKDYIFAGLGENATTCDFTFDNVDLPEGLTYVWSWKSYSNKYYLNGSAYNKQAFAATAYAVSPVIDLAGNTNVYFEFEHAAKFQTSLLTLCGVCVREAGATEWTELTIPTWPAAGDWTFANSGKIDLSAFDGKTIQIAFKYGSTATEADTWEIRNLYVRGTTSAVDEIEAANAPVVYFDLNGRRVNGTPEKGLYIKVQGSKATKVLVK